MTIWYHGTNEYFDKWVISGTSGRLKPELIPHSFISFSVDAELVKGAGNGCCATTITQDARIENMAQDNPFSRLLWERVKNTDFGCRHLASLDYAAWVDMCISGKILRPATAQHLVDERYDNFLRDIQISPSLFSTLLQQNYVRHWIEFIMKQARALGCDGVYCNEYTAYSPTGPRTSENLYIFDASKIMPPSWIRVPTGQKKMAKLLKKYSLEEQVLKRLLSYPYPYV